MTRIKSKPKICAMYCMLLILLSLCINFSCAPTAFADNSCGENVVYSFNDGKLTISGSGAMFHFSEENPAPWKSFADEISSVEILDGVTSIGKMSFYGFDKLSKVVMADSVLAIYSYAFYGCSNLKSVTVSQNLKHIYESAFEGCSSLMSFQIPEGVSRIMNKAFYRCYNLAAITIPESVLVLGNLVFGYCNNLIFANISSQIGELPSGFFLGCEKLSQISFVSEVSDIGEKALDGCGCLRTVYYPVGETETVQFVAEVQKSIEDFSTDRIVNEQKNITNATSTSMYREDATTVVFEVTQLAETESSLIKTTTSIKMETDNDEIINIVSSTAVVSAKLDTADGWADLNNVVEEVKYGEFQTTETIEINVTLDAAKTDVPGLILGAFAGESIQLNVENILGTSIGLDCTRIDSTKLDSAASYNFDFTLLSNEKPSQGQLSVFGESTSYLVKFQEDSDLDKVVSLSLGVGEAMSLATLYYENGSELSKLQTVIVDQQGNANFYLGYTTNQTNYVCALNVSGENKNNAIVPPSLYDSFGITSTITEIIYPSTEIRLYHGLNFIQILMIVFGGLILLGVIVGFVVFAANRQRRLRLIHAIKANDQEEIKRILGSDEE